MKTSFFLLNYIINKIKVFYLCIEYRFICTISKPNTLKWLNITLQLTISLISIYYGAIYGNGVELCEPTGDGESNDSSWYYERNQPPIVNMETKPVLVINGDSFEGRAELPGTSSNLGATSSIVTQNNSVASNIHELPGTPNIHELPGTSSNLGATSSVVTQNNSVASNIHELPTSTRNLATNIYELGNNTSVNTNSNGLPVEGSYVSISQSESTMPQHGSVYSNINELGADNSIRSSIDVQYGSVTPTTIDQHNDQIGYLAPDSALHNAAYDPTERLEPKVGIFDKIITSVKSFDAKVEATTVKYYGMGKRKIYWKVWEKRTNRYESYREFKASWDPNTYVFNKVYKNVKNTVKSELKDTFYLNSDTRTIRNSTTQQVQELMRRNRRR